MVASTNYMNAWLGRCELEVGHWDEAAAIAGALARNPRCAGISRFVALLTLAWVRARRGDPQVAALLDEALSLARSTRHIQRLWPVAACRAEVAWLSDRLEEELDLVHEVTALATELEYRPAMEELAHWQRIGGVPSALASGVEPMTPFGWSASGRHDLAAIGWATVGCPYEEATARLLGGGARDLFRAHAITGELGATPLRERVAAAMRGAGAPVPRGATASTRGNPFSLTDRELDVLALVAAGLTDREIAAQLAISAKTVGHHVSRVLTKLSVRSRAEAAVAAVRSELLADPGMPA